MGNEAEIVNADAAQRERPNQFEVSRTSKHQLSGSTSLRLSFCFSWTRRPCTIYIEAEGLAAAVFCDNQLAIDTAPQLYLVLQT